MDNDVVIHENIPDSHNPPALGMVVLSLYGMVAGLFIGWCLWC
ncbi:MAG: hypothetical protein AB7L92_00865 [Alphaproteobacteria bacterium]